MPKTHSAQKLFFAALTTFFVVSISLTTIRASARPEYAVRYGVNRCTACHYSPAGGGPKNLYGKSFGAFGYKATSWAQQDYAGAEMKVLYYRPAQSDQEKDGMGIMNGSVWASIPVQEATQDSGEVRLIAEQNLGGFSSGPRQWYARWTSDPRDSQTSWLPQYILLGRIIPAFGIMTDEHLTYVRLQSGTPWNTGFDTGVMMSANPVESVHYDIQLADGQKNSGQGLAQNMANIFGVVANLRWMPLFLPLTLGISDELYSAGTQATGASGLSLYGIFSFHRLTRNHVPLTLSVEFVQAQNWNDTFSGGIVSNTTYASSLSNTISRGIYGLLDWQVTQKFSAQYKFDQLALDQSYPSDAYQRHGVGVKYYFGNNLWTLIRYEKAVAQRPGESGGLGAGATDATWALVNFSI